MLFDNGHYSKFYGDQTRWWYGVVQEVASDPLELGRARVRIVGIHGPDIEDSSLPWASVVLPTTGGGVSGVGTTPWLQPTARVFGIFLDGRNSQNPIVIGALPAIEGTAYNAAAGSAGVYGDYNQTRGITTNTNFSGTDPEARAVVEWVFRPISADEFRVLIALTAAESSGDQLEQAWVAGVIINRSRKRNATIQQTANAPSQFHAVTGPVKDTVNYRNGPSESRAKSIYGSITNYLEQVPHDVYYFDSNNVAAYGRVGGAAKYNSVARDRRRAGGNLKIIGKSRFWPGVKY